MGVFNIAVSRRDKFVEYLARNLILEGISYVQIDNEFHFFDNIYRFYDASIDKDFIDSLLSQSQDGFIRILTVNDLLMTKGEVDLKKMLTPIDTSVKDENYCRTVVNKSIPKQSKKLIKRQNNLYNQKLKQVRR